MFELICNPDRIIIGGEIEVTFKVTDEFNRKNFIGQYVYLTFRKNGVIQSKNLNFQRYNGDNLFWTINEFNYVYTGTFLLEIKTSSITSQSKEDRTIACNTFIIEKTVPEKIVYENNISSIENKNEVSRYYPKNGGREIYDGKVNNLKTNKVTLNIQSNSDHVNENNNPIKYSNVIISKGKNVGSK